MGCHQRQASLGVSALLHHDQHFSDQHSSTAGAPTPGPVSTVSHPGSATIIGQQQTSNSIFGLCGDPAALHRCWRISIYLLQQQQQQQQ